MSVHLRIPNEPRIHAFFSPGRFFAANEMKMLMAHLVMTYDIKMEKSSVEPPHSTIGDALIPDNKAKVLCRKRQRQS